MINNKYKQVLFFLSLYPINNINNTNIEKRKLIGVFLKNVKNKNDFLLLLYTLAFFKLKTNKMTSEIYCPSIFTFLKSYKNYESFVRGWLNEIKKAKPKEHKKIDLKKYGIDL